MLLRILLLAGLLTSCEALPGAVTPQPDLPCRAPLIPDPPALDPQDDATGVHLTTLEGAQLYLYIRDVGRSREALADCPHITWSAP